MKITYSLYVAHELDLFNIILKNEPVTLEILCNTLNITKRSAQALLSMCASSGLIECHDNHYTLSELSRCFLNRSGKYYIGNLLDLNLSNKEIMLSYDAFKQAIMTGSPQVYEGNDLFITNQQEAEKNAIFTKAMHAKSISAAQFWSKILNFNAYKTFLDIGGGSGVHSIEAVKNWSHLKAIIYDRPNVCQIADDFIEKEELQDKVITCSGDMWHDPFPSADIHFYCDIFHDWSFERIQFLLNKSYVHLPHQGQIVIHELLFDDNKSGPLSVSMCNLSMLLWTEGQQLSKKELFTLLETAGFKHINFTSTGFGDWSITTGIKI